MFSPVDMSNVKKEMDDLKSRYREQNESIRLFRLSVDALEGSTLGLKSKIEELHNGFKGLSVLKLPWAIPAGRQSGRVSVSRAASAR